MAHTKTGDVLQKSGEVVNQNRRYSHSSFHDICRPKLKLVVEITLKRGSLSQNSNSKSGDVIYCILGQYEWYHENVISIINAYKILFIASIAMFIVFEIVFFLFLKCRS